jgi:hypothetical protein
MCGPGFEPATHWLKRNTHIRSATATGMLAGQNSGPKYQSSKTCQGKQLITRSLCYVALFLSRSNLFFLSTPPHTHILPNLFENAT